MRYRSIGHIIAANKLARRFFFSIDTMHFFKSRIESAEPYQGKFFITSEQTAHGPRVYAVRMCNTLGHIETLFGRGDADGLNHFYTTESAAHADMALAASIGEWKCHKNLR